MPISDKTRGTACETGDGQDISSRLNGFQFPGSGRPALGGAGLRRGPERIVPIYVKGDEAGGIDAGEGKDKGEE